MRHVFGGLLLACCLLLGSSVGSRMYSGPSHANGVLGYYLTETEVVFRFDPSAYLNFTRNDNGDWLAAADVVIDSVAVAGDFNEWSKLAWRMSKTKEGLYELRKDLGLFEDRPEWEFKFVVNGFYWVEPPTDATNRARSGVWHLNRSHNLVLRVS